MSVQPIAPFHSWKSYRCLSPDIRFVEIYILRRLISVFDHYPDHRNFASALTDPTPFSFCQRLRPSTIVERKDIDTLRHSHATMVLDGLAPLDFDDQDELQ